MISYEDIVEEIISKLPKIEKGMKFETIRSIYPDSNIPRDIRNINESLTKPLALSSKDKIKIRKKDDNILKDFLNYKKIKKEKGDLLVVLEANYEFALCENISRPKQISDKYYSNNEIKYVKITYKDILEGNIKQVFRLRA
jgi:hypothetical protein